MSDFTYDLTSGFVTTASGLRLHLHEAGDTQSPTIVMLHGGGAGSMAWTQYCNNIEALSEHFRVIMFDLPQYGRSDKPSFADEGTFPANARMIAEGVDALGITQADFIGTSQGGAVTAYLARDRPHLVRRAVFTSPSGIWDSALSPSPTDLFKETAGFYNPGPATRERLVRILRAMLYDPELLTPEIEQMRWDAASDPEFLTAMKSFGTSTLGDVRSVLPHVHQPALVLWGLEDRILPFDVALHYARLLQNAELVVLQRVAHWIPFERARDFNRLVIDFLTRADNQPIRRP